MTAALARHWTGLDATLICAEAVGVLALVILIPWLWDRARKPRQRPPATTPVSVAIRPRDIQPYDSPAYSAGDASPGEE